MSELLVGEQEMNEAETPGGESEKSGSGIKGILVSAAFTLLGATIGVVGKGVFENSLERQKEAGEQLLERQKFDADLYSVLGNPSDRQNSSGTKYQGFRSDQQITSTVVLIGR